MYATLGATLVILWPPLARPVLDGDSLLYHLPNAAAFVQNASLWKVQAPYWFYPPASELFAAGIFAASGRWSLPIAGALPALLIVARLYAIARANGAEAWRAASIPLAFICTPVAAFEAGTLQNDLWLAAFFVEVLASGSVLAAAICALLKPYGWIEAIIAAWCARVPARLVALAFLPFVFWIARDAVLLGGAGVSFTAAYWSSTIAGNAAIAFPQLANGVAAVTPQAFVWFAALLAGFVFRDTRRYAASGVAAFALYCFLPVSYRAYATNYVLDASSLRYALPALAAGAFVAVVVVARSRAWLAGIAYAVAAWGVWSVLAVFWNDGFARWAVLVAAVCVGAALLARRTRAVSIAAAVLAVLLVGSWAASTRAPGFYADWMRQPSGQPTGAFSWVATHHPRAIVAQNVRTGAIVMASPRTRVIDGDDATPDVCASARAMHALVLAGSNESAQDAALRSLMAHAKSCGKVLFEDGAAVVVQPAP